jgi:hypothetical protein
VRAQGARQLQAQFHFVQDLNKLACWHGANHLTAFVAHQVSLLTSQDAVHTAAANLAPRSRCAELLCRDSIPERGLSLQVLAQKIADAPLQVAHADIVVRVLIGYPPR